MNKQSNAYIIIYSSILVIVVAAALSFTAIKLRPLQQQNVEMEMMSNILGSVGALGDAKEPAAIEAAYKKYITESFLVDSKGNKVDATQQEIFAILGGLKGAYAAPEDSRKLPLFVSNVDGKTNYIVPIIGTGLWGPVWGYMALNDDLNTVAGVVFAHKSETPGLGAEIATPSFQNQYIGKSLFDGTTFKGIGVTKGAGSSDGNAHAVDAISGGTITARAVGDMVINCLKVYVPFFEKVSVEK